MPDDAPTPLSIHQPDGHATRGVVLLQEAFGVNEHIEDVGARLAAAGYLVVAPHLFHRTGDPAFGYDDFSVIRPHLEALNRADVLADIDAALAHLTSSGIAPSAIGAVGFCMGGTLALHTAVEREIGAAVTFYGGGVTEGRFGFPAMAEVAPQLRTPWLGVFGDLDQSIPVDQVEQLRTAAASSGQPTEIVRYADADHGFNCDVRDSHHEASAADAWTKTLAWFATHLA